VSARLVPISGCGANGPVDALLLSHTHADHAGALELRVVL
jgi:glyoxylase-like metal-dependent hydrolase (beta-lactamase superfamily II)